MDRANLAAAALMVLIVAATATLLALHILKSGDGMPPPVVGCGPCHVGL